MSRIRFFFLVLILPFLTFSVYAQSNLSLWYKKPAVKWTEALPIGNGSIGAMIFGHPEKEILQLNESTFWSGGPVKNNVNPQAPVYFEKARKVLLSSDGTPREAIDMVSKMQGVYSQSYLPLADLHLNQDLKGHTISNYRRQLDIENSIATVLFQADGVNYKREVIASAPGQGIVMRLSASQPGKISFLLNLGSKIRHKITAKGSQAIEFTAQAPAQVDPNYVTYNTNPVIYGDSTDCNGMRVALNIQVANIGGLVSTQDSTLSVKQADEVLLFICATTSFNGFDKCPVSEGKDEKKINAEKLQKLTQKPWLTLLADHQKDYHKYFKRVNFSLGEPEKSTNNNPTNERLLEFSRGNTDQDFETLLFQYGRYLLISSSRPGGVPANLQGIWNDLLRAPWSSNYTININTQMNYWQAALTNLEEMEYPLFDFIADLAKTGTRTAKDFYNLKGWVAHHNSDIWALSNPVGDLGKGDPKWANWYMGAPWLSRHLFEHYRFSQDKVFLKKNYPILKGAAEFLLGFLVKDKDGYLITAPSFSPENEYRDDKGRKVSTSIATTMDMSIIRDHFRNCIEAAEILHTDAAFSKKLKDAMAKLYPLHIGKKRNLQEWYQDWEDVEPTHRHVSHLYGLHPGREISPLLSTDIAEAAKKTLNLRGDAGTGWSLAWKINFWARLLDGNHAYKLIRDLMRDVSVSKGGGLYPNLFDAHPPFQIDGNFGLVSGMTEMLLQSQLGEIHILPALPDAWKKGSISGLRARGAFEINMQWDQNRLTAADIKSLAGGICIIRTAQPIQIKGQSDRSIKNNGVYVTKFSTQKGRTYLIIPKI